MYQRRLKRRASSQKIELWKGVTYLHVKIHRARNLLAKDTWSRSSDPYCILTLGSQVQNTQVIPHNTNPVWEEEFAFSLEIGLQIDPTQTLNVECWDYNRAIPDDFLGTFNIALQQITSTSADEPTTEWVQVQKRSLKSSVRGEILISYYLDQNYSSRITKAICKPPLEHRLSRTLSDYTAVRPDGPYKLKVSLLKGRNLKFDGVQRFGRYSYPYVTIKLPGIRQRSRTEQQLDTNDRTVTWNQQFIFPIQDTAELTIRFSVKSSIKGQQAAQASFRDRKMGVAEISLSDVPFVPTLEDVYNVEPIWLPLHRSSRFSAASGDLCVRLTLLPQTILAEAHVKDAKEAIRDGGLTVRKAVELLHRHQETPEAVALVAAELAGLARRDLATMEFYLPQVAHILLNADEPSLSLIHVVLDMCRGSIHFALQFTWIVRGTLQDNISETKNKFCEQLLKDIEEAITQNEDIGDLQDCYATMPMVLKNIVFGSTDVGETMTEAQEATFKEWLENLGAHRLEMFQQQDRFLTGLTNLAEDLRALEPPARKAACEKMLSKFELPPLVYQPIATASFPFAHITRILPKEGTVFSTRARCPTLICFEAMQAVESISTIQAWPGTSMLNSDTPLDVSVGLDPISEEDCDAEATLLNAEAQSARLVEDLDERIAKFSELQGQLFELAQEMSALTNADVALAVRRPDTGEFQHWASPKSLVSKLVFPDHVLAALQSHVINAGTDGNNSQPMSRMGSVDESGVGIGAGVSDERDKPAFDVSKAFGESWAHKAERLRAASPDGNHPGWKLTSLIAKSNDDLRQEVFVLQLISDFKLIFEEAGLPLWVRDYRIISMGSSTGLIETLDSAQSLDSLKKRPGFVNLRQHFITTYDPDNLHQNKPPSAAFVTAQTNFVHSLAAYSIVCYLLQLKDRHNGNIMLDTEGRILHIDFGFLLGCAPGNEWSLEKAPFKLTWEMVQLMEGVGSVVFKEFQALCIQGFLACQAQADRILMLVDIMMKGSRFPCFASEARLSHGNVLDELRDRFFLGHTKKETAVHVRTLIQTSMNNFGTQQYDNFQRLSNGILQ